METVPLGTRSTVRSAVRRGIGVTAAEWSQTCHGVHTRRRRGTAAVQDIIVGIVKRELTRLLDSRLREHSVANISGSMTAALMILNLVIAFCLRVSIGMKSQ